MKKLEPAQLVYSTEKTLFIISAVISGLLWALLTIFTFGIGLMYAGLIFLSILCAHGYFLASIKGYGIRVSEEQFPEIYQLMTDAASDMGMKYNLPEVYIYHLGGIFNAFATHFVSRNFVILTTEAVEACGDDKDKLKFLIAHELCHLHRGHTRWMAFLGPSRLLPFLGDAYSKACEYTCDAHAAYYGVKDVNKSLQAVSMLATVNNKLSDKVNFNRLAQDTRNVSKEFWATVMEINSTHPMTGKRALHLERLLTDGEVPVRAKRNFWGMIFSLVFNLKFLVLIYFAIIIGVIVAVAVDGFEGALDESMREALLSQSVVDDASDYGRISEACSGIYDDYLETEPGSDEEDAVYKAYEDCEAAATEAEALRN